MLISTKTGYALRALSALAEQPAEKPLSVAVLSRDNNLPQKYIEQLFSQLKHSNLIKSIQGSKGGYLLNKQCSEISLKDIMTAVDDILPAGTCYGGSNESEFCLGYPCPFSDFWDDVKKNIENYFDSITLDQIISNLRRRNGKKLF
jgi:Rrf2 family protein